MTAHVSVAFLVSRALGLPYFSVEWVLFFCGAVLIDGDYLLSRTLLPMNHRSLPTHIPATYAVLAPTMLVFPLFPFFLGVAVHLLLDLPDYGLRLNPFSKRLYGLNLIDEPKDDSLGSFLRIYFRNGILRVLEVALAVIAVLVFLVVS